MHALNSSPRSVSWVGWWPWILAVFLALVTVTTLARWLVDRQLGANAEEEGENWVEFVEESVPELGSFLAGGPLAPAASERLKVLSHADEVFRFKLFTPEGQLLLDSRTFEGAPTEPPSDATLAEIRDVAASGEELVTIHHDGKDGFEHYSIANLPIRLDGKIVGVFKVYIDQSERAEATEASMLLLCGVVVLLTLVIGGTAAWRAWHQVRAKLRTEERVRYLASHDVLSGTLNRSSFVEVLEAAAWRARSGGPGFAVLCLDLDRFKEVNDGHGHAHGDEVLRQVGERLRHLLRHGDAVARLGGDEFAVMQSGVVESADVARLAQRIVDALAEPYSVHEVQLRCGGSVGAAIHAPAADGKGADIAALMKQADAALYQAKAKGRGCYSFFDPALDADLQVRRQLLRDLRLARQQGELRLEFQGLFAGPESTLCGYEALMRWAHPSHGEVPPSQFIPLAEEGGLIVDLGAWALHQACCEAAGWPNGLRVSVNLSAAQFGSGDLVATVGDALGRSGLAPERLELEITESLLIHNTEHVLNVLRRLSALGVSIAMDDFGTGYSSLAYLWRFPFDKIKIDRSFVRDIASADGKVDLIVKSIIELAHALRIRVTAEGVETSNQAQALVGLGCDELQGYLLARPAGPGRLAHRQTAPDVSAIKAASRSIAEAAPSPTA